MRWWEDEKVGEKEEWGMGSLEGGIGTRRRPKEQDYGAARCGRRKKRRWEGEKVGRLEKSKTEGWGD